MLFPPEILGLVFSSLDKPTLFNVRLACKAFDEAANPFLFDQIYISSSRTDIEIAKLVALRFGRYVRTLVFASTYVKYSWFGIREWMQLKMSFEAIEASCVRQHVKSVWNRYDKHCAEWEEVNRGGELVGSLCFILGKIARLQTIELVTFSMSRYTTKQSLQLSEPNSACSKCWCILHKKFFDIPLEYICIAEGKMAWHYLMLALSITKTCIKELISDDSGGYQQIACQGSDEISHTQALCLRDNLKDLVILRLTLDAYDYSGEALPGETYDGTVAKMLAAAINLEQLELKCEGDENLSFEGTIGSCKFPKLKSLTLSQFHSTEDQLVDFLSFSPGLASLELFRYDLTQGLWEHMAHWIKHSLQLQSVRIDIPSGEMPCGTEDDELTDFYVGNVDDYILRNGENPFTKEALEREAAAQLARTASNGP